MLNGLNKTNSQFTLQEQRLFKNAYMSLVTISPQTYLLMFFCLYSNIWSRLPSNLLLRRPCIFISRLGLRAVAGIGIRSRKSRVLGRKYSSSLAEVLQVSLTARCWPRRHSTDLVNSTVLPSHKLFMNI